MKIIKALVGLLDLAISTSIWYYLLHSILVAINADRLLWFLYWIYVPVGFILSAVSVIIGQIEEK